MQVVRYLPEFRYFDRPKIDSRFPGFYVFPRSRGFPGILKKFTRICDIQFAADWRDNPLCTTEASTVSRIVLTIRHFQANPLTWLDLILLLGVCGGLFGEGDLGINLANSNLNGLFYAFFHPNCQSCTRYILTSWWLCNFVAFVVRKTWLQ